MSNRRRRPQLSLLIAWAALFASVLSAVGGEQVTEHISIAETEKAPGQFKQKVWISGETELIRDQVLTLALETNGILQENFDYQWSVDPPISHQKWFSGQTSKEVIVEPNAMEADRTYTFTAEVRMKDSGETFWSGDKEIKVIHPPGNGRITIRPFQGMAFDTEFEIEALSWTVGFGPPEYQFLYLDTTGQFSPINTFTHRSKIQRVKLPPTRKVMVKVRDRIGNYLEVATATVYCKVSDEQKLVKKSDELYATIQQSLNFQTSLLSYSQLANNFDSFSSFRGFHVSRSRARELIKHFFLIADKVTAGEISEFSTSDMEVFVQTAVSAFSLLSKSRTMLDHSQVLQIQEVLINLMDTASNKKGPAYPVVSSILKGDPQVRYSLVQTQSNFLNFLYVKLEKDELEGLQYGFVNSFAAEVTEKARSILVSLEHLVGLGLDQGKSSTIWTDNIWMQVQKLNSDQLEIDQNFTFPQMNFTVPVSEAPFGAATLSKIVITENPFLGSNYTTVGGSQKGQQVTAKNTLYLKWRDRLGNPLNMKQMGNTTLEMDFNYNFDRERFSRSLEERLTHCSFMEAVSASSRFSPFVNASAIKSHNFQTKECETELLYEDNKVRCRCQHMSFYTVTRDEYILSFAETERTFNFRNWAAFTLVAYLILVIIFGLVISQNKDQKDIAKLNDIDLEEDPQFSGVEAQQIQFPLLTLALKRQVFFMNFAQEELSMMKLFFISLLQYHPLLQFKFRFDAVTSRQDRFLVLFFQMSLVTLFSFLLFRNVDKPLEGEEAPFQNDEDEISISYSFTTLKSPLAFSFIFSLLFLPVPAFVESWLGTKYLMNETEENFEDNQFDQTNLFDDNEAEDNQGDSAPPENQALERGEQPSSDRRAEADGEAVYLNPNIPLKLLFQMSAYSLNFLGSARGQKKFPFLALETFNDTEAFGSTIIKQEHAMVRKKEQEELKKAEEELGPKRAITPGASKATSKQRKSRQKHDLGASMEENFEDVNFRSGLAKSESTEKQSFSHSFTYPIKFDPVSKTLVLPGSLTSRQQPLDFSQRKLLSGESPENLELPQTLSHEIPSSPEDLKKNPGHLQRASTKKPHGGTPKNFQQTQRKLETAANQTVEDVEEGLTPLGGQPTDLMSSPYKISFPEMKESGQPKFVQSNHFQSIEPPRSSQPFSIDQPQGTQGKEEYFEGGSPLKAYRAQPLPQGGSGSALFGFEGGAPKDAVSSVAEGTVDRGEASDSEEGRDGDPLPKELIEDLSERPSKMRMVLYALICSIHVLILIVLSMEGIHNRKGHVVWVVVIFLSQLIGFLLTNILYFLMMSTFSFSVSQQPLGKQTLSRSLYSYYVLMEDYAHVHKFLNQNS